MTRAGAHWLLVAALAVSCADGPSESRGAADRSRGTASSPPAAPAPTRPTTTTTATATTTAPVEIRLRLDRRTTDAATAGFDAVVRATLTDPRGWQRAGFHFVFAAGAPYAVVLAEAGEVQELCRPYDVFGRYSCQIGPVVALNADRWRGATPEWTGDLAGYRQMLVNHEVGHLLGQHHPDEQCPAPGRPAPVMAQQSTELDGCRPNPWPLPWEIACAAAGLEPLAPGYEPDAQPRCGPDGVTG